VVGLSLIGLELFVIPGFGVPGVLGLLALGGGLVLALTGRDFQFVATGDIMRAVATVAVALLVAALGLVAALALVPRSKRFRGLMLESAVAAGPATATPATWRGLRWFGDATLHPGNGDLRGEDDPGSGNQDNLRVPEATNRLGNRGEVLARQQPAPQPSASASGADRRQSLIGATGKAISDLRPSGVAEIDGQRVDVISAGDYIPAGAAISVIADEQYRRVVRRVEQE
jgi:membrane-bound serine protease (ClpP class)